MKIIILIFIIFLILLTYELIQGIIRQKKRVNIYKMAQKRAQEINKRLIVIGDPYHGNGSRFYNQWMDTYGCGDETVDLTGAPKCPNGIKTSLLSYLKKKPENYGVIFISCVLEYIPTEEFEETIDELKRVAGGLQNIFVVTVNKTSLAAYLYKDKHSSSKQIVYAPPEYPSIKYQRL